MNTARFELTRSIIHNCPALALPQSFAEQMGGVAQLVVLKGATPEVAQFIADACNAACIAADAAIAKATGEAS